MSTNLYKKKDGTLDERKVLDFIKSRNIIYLTDLRRIDESLYKYLHRNHLIEKFKLIKNKPVISKFSKYLDIEILNKFILDNNLKGVADLQKLDGSLYNYLRRYPDIFKSMKFPLDYLIDEARNNFQDFVIKYKITGRECLRNVCGRVLWRIVVDEKLDNNVSYYNQSNKSINFERWINYGLEEIQEYIINNKIIGKADFNKRERGLYNRAVTLKILDKLIFEKDQFASTWERDIFYEFETYIGKTIKSIDLQYKFEDCIDKTCLPFDFKINLMNGKTVILEVTGPYHFINNSVGCFSRFTNLRKHDIIKHNYCKKRDIQLFYYSYSKDLIDKFGYPYYVYTNIKQLLRDMGIIESPYNKKNNKTIIYNE